jgi:hypothetical protein
MIHEHCPLVEEEAYVVLIEPKAMHNKGEQVNERTVEAEWI